MSKHGKANLTTWGYCSAGALGVLAPLCTVELGLLRLHGPGMLMVAGCWVIGGLALPEQLGVIKSKWCPLFVMSCLHLGWLLPAAQAGVEHNNQQTHTRHGMQPPTEEGLVSQNHKLGFNSPMLSETPQQDTTTHSGDA